MRYVFLLGTIGFLALGQVLFKLSAGHDTAHRWAFLFSAPFLAALVVYAVATLMWIFTLRLWPLTIAYPAQALTVVIVLAAGIFGFGEELSRAQYVGVATILSGLMIMALG